MTVDALDLLEDDDLDDLESIEDALGLADDDDDDEESFAERRRRRVRIRRPTGRFMAPRPSRAPVTETQLQAALARVSRDVKRNTANARAAARRAEREGARVTKLKKEVDQVRMMSLLLTLMDGDKSSDSMLPLVLLMGSDSGNQNNMMLPLMIMMMDKD